MILPLACWPPASAAAEKLGKFAIICLGILAESEFHLLQWKGIGLRGLGFFLSWNAHPHLVVRWSLTLKHSNLNIQDNWKSVLKTVQKMHRTHAPDQNKANVTLTKILWMLLTPVKKKILSAQILVDTFQKHRGGCPSRCSASSPSSAWVWLKAALPTCCLASSQSSPAFKEWNPGTKPSAGTKSPNCYTLQLQ